MQRFYPDMDTLHQATLELEGKACEHCGAQALLSHGFVYKKQHHSAPCAVGKRIFCSNRYGRFGCGRTMRLYLSGRVPGLQYGCAHLIAFMLALLAGMSIAGAYQCVTSKEEPRHAYRWLKRFYRRLSFWRVHLPMGKDETGSFSSRCQSLRVLLPTCRLVVGAFAPCAGAHFQLRWQNALI